MKILIILMASIMGHSCASHEFSLLHYNIKELNSIKIAEPDNPQIKAVIKAIENKRFDILSLNEIQYDLPGVPNDDFKTQGKNLDLLKNRLDLRPWNASLAPANTGMDAKRNAQGEYVVDPNSPEARELADQVNFGTFPSQYSTGALTRYEIVDKKVVQDLKWKDFNPKIDLSKFSTPNGDSLPEDIQLFDKNFSDVLLKVGDKKLHLVLLHAVPSFGFGNEKSPNFERNRDQLRFLEWYLTGKTDVPVKLDQLSPINGENFVAVGDLNVDITSNNPGAEVLKRLFSKANPWMRPADMSFTNEGPSFEPRPFRLMLDYMLVSSNIEPIEGEILLPNFQRTELGCGDDIRGERRDSMVLKSYIKENEMCHVLVSEEYERYKAASDHYPIFGRFLIH